MAYMNDMRHTAYQAPEWESRQTFVRTIDAVCKVLGVTRTWLSDSWIARLERDDAQCYLYGYTFPLNNAVVGAIIRDKVATATVLNDAGVAAIPHALLRLRAETDAQSTVAHTLQLAPLPMVIKPNVGESGGYDVVKCDTKDDVTLALSELSARHRVLAVSPFITITHEYRVVVLDGTVLLSYAKHRKPGVWHHNLKLGATPQPITDEALRTKLEQFALVVMRTLGARLAAVDIVDTPDGLHVMEVNSGITLDRFSTYSQKNAQTAHGVYTAIIRASLTGA